MCVNMYTFFGIRLFVILLLNTGFSNSENLNFRTNEKQENSYRPDCGENGYPTRNTPKVKYAEIELKNRGPMELWKDWFIEAKTIPQNTLPQAMSMATVQKNGRPAARILLLRGYDDRGFQIYTDYTSPKATELAHNAWTALTFLWFYNPEGTPNVTGSRQVRVEGYSTKLTQEKNMDYFDHEGVDSQARAFVQRQSQCVDASREQEILEITQNLLQLAKQCPKFKVPFRLDWGGYRIHPESMEFYQSVPHTIADRVKFIKRENLVKGDAQFCRIHRSHGEWIYERIEC